ncbi:OsmC family protein [Neoroseomonas soli]|uniref:OsmC family protein n=1 Tax=Neoroseomonas soli TaxID=1081025 RepID=A0A9X9X1F7_9PROT|nr:OsmC family protein [Neoroseomonas soli]MBR0673236.1 OsmC family protein [Neoroseomonas soli]
MNAVTGTAEMEAPKTKKEKPPLNGVNTPALLATIGVVAGQPQLAKFQFRAQGQWKSGTHMQGTMLGFAGAGGEHAHKFATVAHSDHPAVLCGEDAGPTPTEWILHGLAGCLTAGIANIAAVRGVKLHSVETEIEADIDLQGILGLSDKVRNGFSDVRVNFKVAGDAPAETLKAIVAQAKARSAVFDIMTNGVPVSVFVEA